MEPMTYDELRIKLTARSPLISTLHGFMVNAPSQGYRFYVSKQSTAFKSVCHNIADILSMIYIKPITTKNTHIARVEQGYLKNLDEKHLLSIKTSTTTPPLLL